MTACSRLSACSSLAPSYCSSLGSEAFTSARSELSPPPCTSPALSLCSLASEDFVSAPPRPNSPALVRTEVDPASVEAAAAMDNPKIIQRAQSTNSYLALITLSTLQSIDTHKGLHQAPGTSSPERTEMGLASAEAAAAMGNPRMSRRAHSTNSKYLALITLSTLQDINTHKVKECRGDRGEQEKQEEASDKRNDVEMKKEAKKKGGKMKRLRRAVRRACAIFSGCWRRRMMMKTTKMKVMKMMMKTEMTTPQTGQPDSQLREQWWDVTPCSAGLACPSGGGPEWLSAGFGGGSNCSSSWTMDFILQPLCKVQQGGNRNVVRAHMPPECHTQLMWQLGEPLCARPCC
ncbi:uncharacterized protein LOC134457759 [Engraulis encrasicolus]|uniref:uncharacterized protein LOC134457759 n=1 Tax=Engraulis encrasicolus TaxID=184585 RepID=UPI002FD5C91B